MTTELIYIMTGTVGVWYIVGRIIGKIGELTKKGV